MLDAGNAGETWRRAIETIPGMTGDYARKFNRLEISGINRADGLLCPGARLLQDGLPAARASAAIRAGPEGCHRPDDPRRVQVIGGVAAAAAAEAPARPVVSPHQRLMEAAGHPFVQRASELFGAQPTTVEEG